MKRILLASIAALTLCSGCIFDDEFWEDGYDSTYDSPAGDDWDDCDCDDGEYFSAAKPVAAPPATTVNVTPVEAAR